MKAYIQLIENKVMLSKLPKPDFRTLNPVYTAMDIQEMTNEFNDSIIGEAENIEMYDAGSEGEIPFVVIGKRQSMIKPNQPCEVEKSEDKYIITKL